MNAVVMFYTLLVLRPIQPKQIGRIENGALFTGNSNVQTFAGTSANECLCQALSSSSTAVAINYFSSNNTCQLIISYAPSFQIEAQSQSTLLLIQSPPPSARCSNLTWLVGKIANATEHYKTSVTAPENIIIDNHGRLVTNEYYGDLIQMDRSSLSITNRIRLNNTLLGAVSYNNGLYYIGAGGAGYSDSENALLIYNATDLRLLFKLTGSSTYFGPIRECRFLRNNTQMLVISQVSYSYSLILLYRIHSPTNYTLINTSIQTAAYGACSLYKVNDTFLYFTLYYPGRPIYTLTSSTDGQTWTVGTFVTQGTQPYIVSSIALDSCGRVWAADPYNHIYIYHPITGVLLGTFNGVSKPYYILLLDDYELFISTAGNETHRFAPRVSCSC